MLLRPSLLAAKPAGGGGGYVAKAVHFNAATFFDTLSLIATDNGFFSGCLWLRPTNAGNDNALKIFQVDPNGNFTTNLAIDTRAVDPFYQNLRLSDAANSLNVVQEFSGMTLNHWHSILFTGQTNLGAGSKIIKTYLDDVDAFENISDTDPSFLMAFNGLEFALFQDGFGDGYEGDASDCWLAPGQSLLTGADISLATRRKFVAAGNKPVFLGANGELPTGTAPAIFFSGDATAFGQPNLGTGGAFTLTGTLTNASTSPSD